MYSFTSKLGEMGKKFDSFILNFDEILSKTSEANVIVTQTAQTQVKTNDYMLPKIITIFKSLILL